MRTLLVAAFLVVGLLAVAPSASAQRDLCSEPANSTVEYVCGVRDSTVAYANCYLRENGPLEWTECL